MGLVTHFPPICNALRGDDETQDHEAVTRPCSGCGREFQVVRRWQKHCSPKCRVRVHRQAQVAPGYYGA